MFLGTRADDTMIRVQPASLGKRPGGRIRMPVKTGGCGGYPVNTPYRPTNDAATA